jgi:hypothetical protein
MIRQGRNSSECPAGNRRHCDQTWRIDETWRSYFGGAWPACHWREPRGLRQRSAQTLTKRGSIVKVLPCIAPFRRTDRHLYFRQGTRGVQRSDEVGALVRARVYVPLMTSITGWERRPLLPFSTSSQFPYGTSPPSQPGFEWSFADLHFRCAWQSPAPGGSR